ncbi:MAG: hypothetical protein K8S87_12230, partial [Planctomycetes bacterium]|nr:hypothetical protein [Planctomycetota bacterium]
KKFGLIFTQNEVEQDLSKKPGFFCTIKVNDKNEIEFESQSDDFPEEVKTEMQNRQMINYYPPKEPIAIGTEWKISDDIIRKQMAQYELKEIEAKMKLEKITTKGKGADKIEIANINYLISFDATDKATKINIKGAGEGLILVDITNHRLLNSNTVIKMNGSGDYMGVVMDIDGTITIFDKFIYKGEKSSVKEKIAPKDDE